MTHIYSKTLGVFGAYFLEIPGYMSLHIYLHAKTLRATIQMFDVILNISTNQVDYHIQQQGRIAKERIPQSY